MLRKLRKKKKSEIYGIYLLVNRKKKIVYSKPLLGKEEKTKLECANLELMSKLIRFFDINPFEYGIKCVDCGKRLDTLIRPKKKKLIERSSGISNKTSLPNILLFIKVDDDILFISYALAYLENIVDAYQKIRKLENRYMHTITLYNNFYTIFNECKGILQNNDIKEYMVKCFLKHTYIDKVTQNNLEKQIFSIYNFVEYIYDETKNYVLINNANATDFPPFKEIRDRPTQNNK